MASYQFRTGVPPIVKANTPNEPVYQLRYVDNSPSQI